MKLLAGLLGAASVALLANAYIDAGRLNALNAQLEQSALALDDIQVKLVKLERDNNRLLALNNHLELLAASLSPSSLPAPLVTSAPDPLNMSSANIQSLLAHDSDALLVRKHALLLSSLKLSSDKEDALKKLLAMRERIANTSSISETSTPAEIEAFVRTQQAALADIDNQITAMLDGADRETYGLLKDSTYEQSQLLEFLAQAPDAGSLSDTDKQNLLRTKLVQKKQFYSQLEHLSRDIYAAQGEGRTQLIEQAREALHSFKDDYLREARSNLSDAQFDALREYEQQHFDEIWASLAAGFGG